MNFSVLFLCFIDHLILASNFRQLPCRYFLEFSHPLSTAAFASGTRLIPSLHCGLHDFYVEFLPNALSYIRRLQRCTRFCLGSIRSATSFLVLSSPDLARHCCWHRAQSSSVVKLPFFDSPFLFFFSLRCF